jgi:hypothetical protein
MHPFGYRGAREKVKAPGTAVRGFEADVRAHTQGGVQVEPVGLSLRDGRWDLGRVPRGQSARMDVRVRSAYEVAYMVGRLGAAVTEIQGAARGPLPGQDVGVEVRTASDWGDTVPVEIPPRPAGKPGADDSEADSNTPTATVSLRLPPRSWSLARAEEVTGTLNLSLTGKLQAMAGDVPAGTQAELPPTEAALPFVLVQEQDVTKAASAIGLGLLLLAALMAAGIGGQRSVTLVLAGRPETMATFRRFFGQSVTLGGPGSHFLLPGAKGTLATLRYGRQGWQVQPQAGVQLTLNEEAVPAGRRIRPGDRLTLQEAVEARYEVQAIARAVRAPSGSKDPWGTA